MNAEARQPTDDGPRPEGRPSVIAIAADGETQNRIAAALAEQNLRVSDQVDTPSEVTELAADDSTVVVFVCDIDAPREMASLRRLCREAPDATVVVISPPATGPGVRRALDAGATGLVLNSELKLTLATTIRAVAIGQTVVPRKLRAGVEAPILSHREHQVLALVRTGLTNAEIAERLYLAESTIKSHLASIFTKFGVRSRKEVTAALVDLEQTALVTAGVLSGSDSAEQATA
jgi:two-component system, NarL family, response regulator, fimbrial Z protein, FimZ